MADMKERSSGGGDRNGGEVQPRGPGYAQRGRRSVQSSNGGGRHHASSRPVAAPARSGAPPHGSTRGARERQQSGTGRGRGRAYGGSIGGGSRKATARDDAATTPLFADDAGGSSFLSPPSSYEEGAGFPESYYGSSPSASSSGGSSPLSTSPMATSSHRFNVNAPAFRPSPASSAPVLISLTASAPSLPFGAGPLPREAPAEERRRDRKERRKISRSDHFRVPANYLLNFSYERPQHDWSAPARRRGPVVEFKKERFLQANYRFVVNAQGNYLRHLYETDQLVEWDDIEQIVLQTSVPYNCPICLDAPMAPKMTKCGHIYCWSCISRYLGMAQKGWRKCPICFDSVSTKHLKSTAIEIVPEYHEEDKIVLTLMRRHKDCTVALPSVRWRPMEELLRHDDPDSIFSRIVLVDDITPILDKEQEEVGESLAQARASNDFDSLTYLEDAMKSIQERRELFAAKQAASKPPARPISDLRASHERTGKSDVWSDSEANEEKNSAHHIATATDERSKEEEEEAEAEEPNETKKASADGKQHAEAVTVSPDIFYFYQARDGQNIFMHPLSFRCLHKEVGSFDKLPQTVEAKIVQLEEVSQSDKMRKRRKMIIGHLPLSTQFQFCEVDLAHLVSEKTLASFADEFKFREAKRQQIKQERATPPTPPPASAPSAPQRNAEEEDDPLLAAALAESQRMAAEASASASTSAAPVSIPTTPCSETTASSTSGGSLQGVWAKKQSAVPVPAKKQVPPAPKPASQVPTFSQVARNEVWSGWKDDAFPTVDAAHQSAKRTNNGQHSSTTGAGGAKNKKRQQVLLVSNAGGRRY